MDYSNILNVLEKLGVKGVINGNNINFYDTTYDIPMSIYELNSADLPMDMIKPYKFYTIYSSKKMVRIELRNPRLNNKLDESSILLTRTHYDDTHEEHIIDIEFWPIVSMRVQSFNKENGDYSNRTEVKICSDDYISFEANGKFGEYDKAFDEEYGLTSSEMIDTLNSNMVIPIFSNYYGSTYPDLLKTMEKACTNSKTYKK